MKNLVGKALGKFGFTKLTPEETFLRGLPLSGQKANNQTVSPAYERSSIAYACIRRIATDAGNAPFLLLSDPEDPESTIPDSHPIAILFNRPNPWFGTAQFLEYIYTVLNLRGEFFITFDNPTAPQEMIQFYDPLYWTDLVSSDMRLKAYRFGHQNVSMLHLPSEIIHHRFNSMRSVYRGQSPLVAAANSLWTGIYGGDLAHNLMANGGEQGIVYQTTEKLTPKQEEELTASLKARRKSTATIANDMLLTGGMEILDPKFTGFDYSLFEMIKPSDQKIIEVYGLSPSLIGRDDEPNYATFMGRLRIYWRQTLLPMMTAVESTFDKHFESFGVYFRYDKANIQGLQEDLMELSKTAVILHRGGIPWDVVNDRLKLGLDTDSIPGSDDVMVPGTMAPLSMLIEDWEESGDEPDPPAAPAPPPVTDDPDKPEEEEEKPPEEEEEKNRLPDFETAMNRAKDIGSMISRNRALAGLERAIASGWRKQGGKYKKLAVSEMEKALAENHTVEGAVRQFQDKFGPVMTGKDAPYNQDSIELIQPRHIGSLGIGETSVEEITKRLSAEDIEWFRKQPEEFLSAKSLAFIAERENLVVGMGEKLFADMMADVWELAEIEGETAEVAGAVRHSFNVSVNRAVTIGRTEVGTAFNVGRFNNMQEQGYTYHEWITNIDEFTREEHAESDGLARRVGDLFPSGLAYPQDPSGSAEQVINCRCLTIPMTEEQFNEGT